MLLAKGRVPEPTGHDRTAIACFQRANRPGSLLEILAHFATRNVDLTRLESRPTKRALGQYCFIIESEGHIADVPLLGDCLAELHTMLEGLEFLSARTRSRVPAPALMAPGPRRPGTERSGSRRCGSSSTAGGEVPGGMAERTNAAVLKTVGPQASGVRIPLPPQKSALQERCGSDC